MLHRTLRYSLTSALLVFCGPVFGQETALSPDEQAARIFATKCARCHGADGEGASDAYQKPLRGSESLDELTELISETMPEDSPEDCTGQEARLLAEYIRRHYLDRKPSRGLTRLTVAQYRNAIADVIGRFAPGKVASEYGERGRRSYEMRPGQQSTVPGLRAEYYQSKGMSKADQLGFYRSDTSIEFDFAHGSPAPTISPDQFSIIWQGGVFAGDSGDYEFRVTTQNGARLYLNLDPRESRRKLRDDASIEGQQALIDVWVGSGELRSRSAKVFLLGGRRYAIRLEFFKYLEKTSSIKLEWKPPHGTWSVLDYNHTTSFRPPRVYVCDVPFPADDRSLGYERGNSISAQWHTATTEAAVAAANEVVARLPLLAGFAEDTDLEERRELVEHFVVRFAEVAYRRPLTSTEEELYGQVALSDPTNLEAGVQRAVVMALMSPHFLYADLTPGGAQPSQYTIASRLSFGLWDSIPDERLLKAAAEGKLGTADEIRQQALRMMFDPRTKGKIRDFFRAWLELDERDLAKDKQLFPEFDEAVIADLRESLELFVERIVWSRDSDYRELLLADYIALNPRLRELYPSAIEETDEGLQDGREIKRRANRRQFASEFQPVDFPEDQRSGVLTHPYLLSAYSYHNSTSPIHRGVFLTRNIVGRVLSPPPIAVAFKDDEFAPDLTMREKITQLTRDTACMSCHSVINPLGFTLENFDAVGRWRTTDNDKPVDTKSRYTTSSGETVEVASARDIAKFAVESEAAHRSFITHVFEHVVKKSPYDFDADLAEQLREQFADDDFNIRNLWANVAATAAAHDLTSTSPTTE